MPIFFEILKQKEIFHHHHHHHHQINIGVRGFRVDASKHMWPGDLAAIQGMTQVGSLDC